MEKGPDGIMAAEKERNDHGEEGSKCEAGFWFLKSGEVREWRGAKSTVSMSFD